MAHDEHEPHQRARGHFFEQRPHAQRGQAQRRRAHHAGEPRGAARVQVDQALAHEGAAAHAPCTRAQPRDEAHPRRGRVSKREVGQDKGRVQCFKSTAQLFSKQVKSATKIAVQSPARNAKARAW